MVAELGGDAPRVDCAWLAIDVIISWAICGARVASCAEWPVVSATGNRARIVVTAMAMTPRASTTSMRVKAWRGRLSANRVFMVSALRAALRDQSSGQQ